MNFIFKIVIFYFSAVLYSSTKIKLKHRLKNTLTTKIQSGGKKLKKSSILTEY